jgi:hypothetical protein
MLPGQFLHLGWGTSRRTARAHWLLCASAVK